MGNYRRLVQCSDGRYSMHVHEDISSPEIYPKVRGLLNKYLNVVESDRAWWGLHEAEKLYT